MRAYRFIVCAALGWVVLAPSAARAQGFTTNDTQLDFAGNSVSPGQATARAGFTGSPAPGGGIVPIYFYRLPTLAANTTITSAVLSINLASLTTAGGINYNVDLYAIPFRTTPTISILDFFVGAQDPSSTVTRIQDNFVARANPTSATTLGRYNTDATGSTSLATFLNTQYANGAVGGASGNFVFFRLSPDGTTPIANGGYNFSTQDEPTTSLRPTLTLTFGSTLVTTPEPGAAALAALGLLLAGAGRATRRRRTG